ncbi:MAG: hypothetical protein ACK2U1_14530 [Anaerolineales bacterium]
MQFHNCNPGFLFLQPTVEDYIPQVPLGAQDAALVLKEDELP